MSGPSLLGGTGKGFGRPDGHPRAAAVPAIAAAGILVVVASVIVGIGDSRLKAYDLVETDVGTPRLTSFLLDPAQVPGWTPGYLTQFQNGKLEFGDDSLWYRFIYRPSGQPGPLRSTAPVTADVINASGISGFEAFTVQDCYDFHGWEERGTVQENLGGGIVGQALSYDSPYGDWSVIYWVWPVLGTQYDVTASRYERVVLYLQDGADATVRDPLTGVVTTAAMTFDQRLTVNRDFLTGFAREIIKKQKTATGTSLATEAVGG